MLSQEDLEKQEDALRARVTALEPELRQRYYALEKKRLRDPDTYAVLNYFILGGLHHFYLGRYLWGTVNFALIACGLIYWGIGGWLLVLLVVLIELPQLFRAQRIVHAFNNTVMESCLLRVQSDTPE